MAIDMPPEISEICQVASYDRDLSEVRWSASGTGRKVGRIVGANNGGGYRRVNILGYRTMYHRLVWAMHYGEWPEGFIDHINGNRSDNSIANLRVVTKAENTRNRRPGPPRDLPFGVYRNGSGFQASIRSDGKWIGLGTYKTAEEAAQVYHAAKEKYGFHKNHGVKT